MKVGGFVSDEARAEFCAAYDRGMATLPTPTDQWDVPTAFGHARVYRFGEGTTSTAPIVLLPGRAGTVVMWEPNLRALAARHPVYALDLLGEPGRSVQTAPVRSSDDQAAWLAAVLSELDLTDVHVVGYSFGGWLAANLAVRRPDRLASLTALDPVQTFARFPLGLVARSTLTVVPGIRGRARTSFLSWMSGDADAAARGSNDPVVNVIDTGMRTYRIALPTPTVFTDKQLRGLRLPVLALIAGRSVIHDGRRAADRARRLVTEADVELWPSATHAIAGEYAAAVSNRILTFLAHRETTS
ncbi:pimeloyl-ACP methyl ester carboxylesterase [Prauserella isguenensis]|uniref:Pimeloyl-ACP methyl ester carboxylesterase n=1 Tax=Prauserella isguenensis TaxID=1470180 RepID=A0A839S559_9PSEU|nr:alpha/beta hydrolase [Prauserella isguenensis]MBB3052494.1 pimeloyl-ACP methyl ester carboxylesterase [Prauserella isguenensis]